MTDLRPTIALPSAESPAVSIVVLGTRNAERFVSCLTAIAESADPAIPAETILVLNDPEPALRAAAVDGTTGARIVETGIDVGIAAGWNLAFSIARGDWLALLHEDAYPQAGWLTPLLETARADPRIGIVGSRLIQPATRRERFGAVLLGNGTRVQIDPAPPSPRRELAAPVDICPSASGLIARAAWEAAGGFDEDFYPAMGVDWDFSTAAWSAGFAAFCEPRSIVLHDGGASIDPAGGPFASRAYRDHAKERNRARFARKWATVLEHEREPAPPADDPAASAAAVERALDRADQRFARLAPRVGTVASAPASPPDLEAGPDGVLLAPPAFLDEQRERRLLVLADFAAREHERAEGLATTVARQNEKIAALRDRVRAQRERIRELRG